MQLIIFIPFIIALILLLFYNPEKVFLFVYLPVLILLPQNFTYHIPRVPDLSVCQLTIIPIMVAALITRFYLWRFTFTDVLLLAYFSLCMYSEYVNEGLGSWAAMTATMLTGVIFPYALAKLLIHPLRMTVDYAKACVILPFINFILSPYELRLTVNPYLELFSRFFPGQGDEWATITRYGVVRFSGPFMQPIFNGIMLTTSWLLNYWLSLNRYWGRYRYFPSLGIPKSYLYGIALFIGLILTFSRGPLISGFFGFMFVGVGFSKQPFKTLIVRTLFFAVSVFCVWQFYTIYINSIPSEDASDQERTLLYRSELMANYESIAMEEWELGWGVDSWPKTSLGTSVDNEYLVLALSHGLYAVGLLVGIMAYVLFRVFLRGLLAPIKDIEERSLAFTFFGIYLTMCVAFTTVYMGLQLTPLFFILTGWIEGFLATRPRTAEEWHVDRSKLVKKVKYA